MGPYTNHRFSKFGVKEDPSCEYCGMEKQDFEHLFMKCPEVDALRDRIAARWNTNPTLKEWIFGTTNESSEDRAKTYIMMELNYYMQRTNWKGNALSLSNFKSNLRSTFFSKAFRFPSMSLDIFNA